MPSQDSGKCAASSHQQRSRNFQDSGDEHDHDARTTEFRDSDVGAEKRQKDPDAETESQLVPRDIHPQQEHTEEGQCVTVGERSVTKTAIYKMDKRGGTTRSENECCEPEGTTRLCVSFRRTAVPRGIFSVPQTLKHGQAASVSLHRRCPLTRSLHSVRELHSGPLLCRTLDLWERAWTCSTRQVAPMHLPLTLAAAIAHSLHHIDYIAT